MASIDTNSVIGPERPMGLMARILATLRRKNDAARMERVIARDISAVRALGDELLRDIGLNRGDIEFTIRNGRLPDR